MSCQRHIGMALHHSRCIWTDTFLPGICPLLSYHAVQLIQADNSGNIAIGRPAVGRIHLFYFRRRTKTNASNGQQQENFITFGNLSLSLQEACFYNEQQEKLKLTPMQYTLMEMFYLSSSHLLFKSDICQSLWPGKDNADETLYTLIRRLKPIVEDNSNLRITTDRGRAYGLEIKPKHYRIMKTNKLILLGLICLTVAMPTTAQNRNERKSALNVL